MTFGNKSFTGSLVKPLVNPQGAPPIARPITVVSGGESFVMDVQDSSDNSIQVIVGRISTAANTSTVTQASGISIVTGNLVMATGGANMWTGVLVRATSSTTLPTGIAGATNYFVYVIDATNIVLFSSLATCLQAKAIYNNAIPPPSTSGLIVPSALGAGTMTLTPTALSAASYKLQGSNDYMPAPMVVGSDTSGTGAATPLIAGNWFDLVAGESPSALVTNTVTTASTTSRVNSRDCGYAYVRILFTISAGTAEVQVIGHS